MPMQKAVSPCIEKTTENLTNLLIIRLYPTVATIPNRRQLQIKSKNFIYVSIMCCGFEALELKVRIVSKKC